MKDIGKIKIVNVVFIIAIISILAIVADQKRVGRYSFMKSNGSILILDTKTGGIEACIDNGDKQVPGMICKELTKNDKK